MAETPPEEKRFITNVLDLTDLIHELSTVCWDAGVKDINPTMVLLAGSYLKTYDPVTLIEVFIKHSHMHWNKIKERSENFFIDNAHVIFQQLPMDSKNINAFKVLFTAVDDKGNKIIGQDDRNAVWDIFDSLVKICIKYIHTARGVKLVQTPNGLRPAYKNKKFGDIKVRELAKIWEITLTLPTTQN
jgi:hypothetical protein